MRDDITTSLNLILAKLTLKKENLNSFLNIERKISEILLNERDEEILPLISEETDILERINLIDCEIAGAKDNIKRSTGMDFEAFLKYSAINSFREAEIIKDITAIIEDSIKKIGSVKKKNIQLLEECSSDLSQQVKELEIMNRIIVIPPKDLQSF